MNWLHYLIEANLYLTVFYGLYRLLLHRETFYELNRYYLLVTVPMAFILPLLQIGYLNQLLSAYFHRDMAGTVPRVIAEQAGVQDLSGPELFMLSAYLIIAAVLFIRLVCNVSKILALTMKSKKRKHRNVIYVELRDTRTAFSFFNFLFINPLTKEKSTVLKHEMVHIRQMHSADILFFEFIQVLSWFNPVIVLIRKDIQLTHEFIADHLTTKSAMKKHDYAMFLIQNSFGNTPALLTNQIFNQSILKKRINMLNKERSAGRTRFRLLYVLPIAGGMLCASTMAFTKDYAVIDLYPEKYKPVNAAFQEPAKKKTAAQKAGPKEAARTNQPEKVQVVKFPPPVVKPDAPKKVKPAKIVKFPPPIVTKDVPPPPPPAPPPAKPDDNSVAVKPKASATYSYSIKEADATEIKADEIKRATFKNDKGQAKSFTYQISVKTEEQLEKIKSDGKQIRIDNSEKGPAGPVKKD